jgi:predicted DNA-binding transcriptional regulator AlpA
MVRPTERRGGGVGALSMPSELPAAIREASDLLEAAASQLSRGPALRLLGRLEEIRAGVLLRLAAEQQPAHAAAAVRAIPPAGELLTVEKFSKRIGMSEDWVYQHQMEIPHTKVGRRGIRFSEAQIRRYLESRQTGG